MRAGRSSRASDCATCLEPGAGRVDIGEPHPGPPPPCTDLRQPLTAGAPEHLGARRVPGGVAHRVARELDAERPRARPSRGGASRRARSRDRAHSSPRRAQVLGGGGEASRCSAGKGCRKAVGPCSSPISSRDSRTPCQMPAGAREEPAARGGMVMQPQALDPGRLQPGEHASSTVAATSRALMISVACRPATCR